MTDTFSSICKEFLESGGAMVSKHLCSVADSKLDYQQCTRMILDIGGQIESLRENGLGLLYITTDDITITSDGSYILTPLEDPMLCDDKGMLLIDRPYTYDKDIMAPELKEINRLPSKVFYTSVYYSLKPLVLKVMGLTDLRQLSPTKLFYLIERCSVDVPEKRNFIFV